MPKHIWSVLCSKSVIDKESNNVSLFEILEEVQIAPFVTEKASTEAASRGFFALEWVSLWARESYGRASITEAKDLVLAPSGVVIFEAPYTIDLTKHERTRLRRIVGNLPLKESGQYQFCTQMKDEDKDMWQDVSSIPLTIKIETSKVKQA